MAEAIGATTQTTTVTPPAPAAATSTPAPAAAVATSTPAPLPGASSTTAAPVVHPVAETSTGRKLTAVQRMEAALAKVEGAESAKPVVPAPEKPADAAPPAGEKKPDATAKPEDDPAKKAADEAAAKAKAEADEKVKAEQAAKDNPRLSRAMAIVAERERKVAAREKELTGKLEAERRAFEAERSTWTQSKAVDESDLKFVRDVRATIATKGKAAAAALFGFTMDELVDAKSREVEPRPEDIFRQAEERARAIAAEEFKRWQAAEKTAAEKAKVEADEKAAAEKTVSAHEFVGRVVAEHNADPNKRAWLSRTPVTGEQIWTLEQNMEAQLGRKPSPSEVLDAAEKIFVDRYGPAPWTVAPTPQPAPVPPPSPTVPAAGAPQQTQPPPAEQPRGRTKRVSPLDRASAILQRRGLQ